MCDSYIVKWWHGINPRYQWFIRGIKSDRSFYGELMISEPRRAGINVEGRLSEADYLRLVESFAEIQEHTPCDEACEGWEGLIAFGSIAHPAKIYRCRSNSDDSPAAVAFLQVIEVLSPYLRNYELSLMPT